MLWISSCTQGVDRVACNDGGEAQDCPKKSISLVFLSSEEAKRRGCQESLCKNNLFRRSGAVYLFNLRSHMLALLPAGGEKTERSGINTSLSIDCEPDASRIPYTSAKISSLKAAVALSYRRLLV